MRPTPSLIPRLGSFIPRLPSSSAAAAAISSEAIAATRPALPFALGLADRGDVAHGQHHLADVGAAGAPTTPGWTREWWEVPQDTSRDPGQASHGWKEGLEKGIGIRAPGKVRIPFDRMPLGPGPVIRPPPANIPPPSPYPGASIPQGINMLADAIEEVAPAADTVVRAADHSVTYSKPSRPVKAPAQPVSAPKAGPEPPFPQPARVPYDTDPIRGPAIGGPVNPVSHPPFHTLYRTKDGRTSSVPAPTLAWCDFLSMV